MNLRDLQQGFLNALRDPAAFGALEDVILPRASADLTRLRVHRRSMYGALLDALSAAYPVCRLLVGSPFFDALGRRYLRDRPSRSPNLNDYGAELADFLEAFEPADSLPYLPDVARVEWACQRAAARPAGPEPDLVALAMLGPEDQEALTFSLAPAVCLIRSKHPVWQIWAAHQGTNASDPASLMVTLQASGEDVIVSPGDQGPNVERVEAVAWDLLDALGEGLALGALPGRLISALPGYLGHFVNQRWATPVLPPRPSDQDP